MKNTGRLFSTLVNLMDTLRSKNGCPWDRKQTHRSIKSCLVEETCEVLEAIDKKNPEKLKEELGDLLYQIIFHARIARERTKFDINDVLAGIYQKLKRRHPHVFGKKRIRGANHVIEAWHRQKVKEELRNSRKSILENIPHTLPALHKASKVQRKAAVVGFDWKHIREVLAKVEEELREVKEAISKHRAGKINEEIGDLLFAIVDLSRFLGIEPENALHETINKFIVRFKKMEKLLAIKYSTS
jgi:tetrapyrrole methylase family protein/MazG family protein